MISTSSASSSSSAVYRARRCHGVCRGSLWRQQTTTPQSEGAGSSSTKTALEYCILTGVTMTAYESSYAYRRGDLPLACLHIVGANAWNPPIQAPMMDSSTGGSTSENSSLSTSSSSCGFRLVTHQGTHVMCTAPSANCRDVWLAALQAGLEQCWLKQQQPHSTSDLNLTPPSPPKSSTNMFSRRKSSSKPYFCQSCGCYDTNTGNTSTDLKKTRVVLPNAVPLPQYKGLGEGRCSVCPECQVAQGVWFQAEFLKQLYISARQENQAWMEAREMIMAVTAATTQTAFAPDNWSDPVVEIVSTTNTNTLLPVSATAQDTSEESWTQVGSGGGSIHTNSDTASPPPPATSIVETELSCSWISQVSGVAAATTTSDPIEPSSPQTITSTFHSINQSTMMSSTVTTQLWVQVPPNEATTKALMHLVASITFGSFRRACPLLDLLCLQVERGDIGIPDFLEQVDEICGMSSTSEEAQLLKKQAFRVAGDMGTAMKLLVDHAAAKSETQQQQPPTPQQQAHPSVFGVTEERSATDMVACILEFFLDLCQEGDLSSVSFFWPQLCHIHLLMLPAEDIMALRRVELMEDFLITVACRYSVHLALELVWNHTADLEDSLFNPNASSACRRRRFAVLRFICELESLLFDFEQGWGGGSVSLRHMLLPSVHQVLLLKQTMMELQDYRQRQQEMASNSFYCFYFPHLSRSVRWDKLSNPDERESLPPEQAALQALRIARNADYISSHLSFTRRLCEIAEKLRFMEVEQRPAALTRELESLNSSGGMGGDPLNKVRAYLTRVVRIPPQEGHVFRSKERTPVLLLLEVLADDGGVISEPTGEKEDDPPQQLKPEQLRSKPRNNVESVLDSELPEFSEHETQGSSTHVEDPDDHEVADIQKQSVEVENPELQAASSNSSVRNDEGVATEAPRSASPTSALEGSMVEQSPRHALRRFDSPQPTRLSSEAAATLTGEPLHDDLHELVSNVIQLNLPDLQKLQALDEGKESDGEAEEVKEDGKERVTGNEKNMEEDSEVLETSSPTSSTNALQSLRRSGNKRLSTLGAYASGDGLQSNPLAPSGDIRRDVLNAIMIKGKLGSSTIAAGAAANAQRSLQELDRRRAVELLLGPDDSSRIKSDDMAAYTSAEEATRQMLNALGIESTNTEQADEDGTGSKLNEEDEAMDALRLLLIQYRVAQGSLGSERSGSLSPARHSSLNKVKSSDEKWNDSDDMNMDESENPQIDAGDVDARLAGCGVLPPAVLQALTLWKGGLVSHGELLELVKKDILYLNQSALVGSEKVDKLKEDSAFWGRFAFGERWAEKKARLAAKSPQGCLPGWDLLGIIIKSNDDLRQEAFAMQLIELCQEAFQVAGLELWLHPYRILATGRSTGIIEMVRNAMSFDALKKRPGYGKGGLREHLRRMTEYTADPGEAFKSAQSNFVRSLASYSLMSYFFLFKDRHNGNILLDTAGHVIHIDFGFVFGIAPGGSFSLEMSTPFKLTEEMLDVMGGLRSPLFSEFVTLFCCGFLALQAHCDTFMTLVEITCRDSTFKCFQGRDSHEILLKLRERFCPTLDKEATVAFALELIKQATTSYGTKQYDYFQYLSQGIAT